MEYNTLLLKKSIMIKLYKCFTFLGKTSYLQGFS